ncbi:MAG TPA: alpha/beta fold hydrolase, partial [Microbacterium sp.]|nr:alpha/beta fold hydrolase [Microbacterium sp.]
AALIADEKATDVLVLTHGWNNDPAAARALYKSLMSSFGAVRSKVARARGRRFVVLGMLWPSILWAPPDDGEGGGAGLGDETEGLRALIEQQVEEPSRRAKLIALLPALETSPEARAEFVKVLRAKLPAGAVDDDDPDSAPKALRTADAETIFDAAAGGQSLTGATAGVGGAADIGGMGAFDEGEGGAAGFSFGGILDAARNVVNTMTYYTMKERAGVVGTKGIAALLNRLHEAAPEARLHLVGHSFGGRAVTAAADKTTAPVSSVSLLQAAYSHYGMAQDWDGAGARGAFFRVPGRTEGPVIVTFTRNDKAVGLAYPVASRIARQVGVGIGDANDKYGGIGRNGALKTPASLPAGALLDVGGEYAFAPGRVSSLDGDRFISGHSDVTGRQVAYAVLCAATTAG